MRTYLILKEKAARWNADPEIQALVKELTKPSAAGTFSQDGAAKLKATRVRSHVARGARTRLRAPRSADDGSAPGRQMTTRQQLEAAFASSWRHGLVLLFFVLLPLATTWPLAAHLGTQVPGEVAGDNLSDALEFLVHAPVARLERPRLVAHEFPLLSWRRRFCSAHAHRAERLDWRHRARRRLRNHRAQRRPAWRADARRIPARICWPGTSQATAARRSSRACSSVRRRSSRRGCSATSTSSARGDCRSSHGRGCVRSARRGRGGVGCGVECGPGRREAVGRGIRGGLGRCGRHGVLAAVALQRLLLLRLRARRSSSACSRCGGRGFAGNAPRLRLPGPGSTARSSHSSSSPSSSTAAITMTGGFTWNVAGARISMRNGLNVRTVAWVLAFDRRVAAHQVCVHASHAPHALAIPGPRAAAPNGSIAR